MKQLVKVIALPSVELTKGMLIREGNEWRIAESQSNDLFNSKVKGYHLHFVVDERPQEGEYAYQERRNVVWKFTTKKNIADQWEKVLATTDHSIGGCWCDGLCADWDRCDNADEPRLGKIPDTFKKAFALSNGEITEVAIEMETLGDWKFERSSGFTGDRCQKCGTWRYKGKELVCNCGLKPKLRDDWTVIVHKAKTYTPHEVMLCVSEVASSLGYTPTSNKMKEFNEATRKWLAEN